MIKIVEKVKVEKGWSADEKYCVRDDSGTKYLLRLSAIQKQEQKKKEFDLMKQVSELGIPMCQPIEFGVCDDGVYSIQSWIDGSDAEHALKNLLPEEQYAYGLEAGRILRRIHSIPAPASIESWELRYNRKLDRKINAYQDCSLKYEDGQTFLDYVTESRNLLRGRPQVFQHGDYHRGNMMIGTNKKLYIIDFNRYDWGDPWEDMTAITWDVQLSPYFASGRVDGYFEGDVPDEFWKLLKLYIYQGIISSLPWAIPFGKEEIDTMQKQAQNILSWFDDKAQVVPNWYVLRKG